MRTKIEHCAIWTGQELLEAGHIVIDGDRIATVGAGPYPPLAPVCDRSVSAPGRLALPGFVNAHGHAAMTLLRGYADDLPLQTWLADRIWPAEDGLTARDVKIGAELALCEMIASGTTTFADMYVFMDVVAQTVEAAGVRAVLARGLVGLDGNPVAKLQDAATLFREFNGAGGGRVRIVLGPHAPYTCPPPFLRAVVDLSAELDANIHIHLAETAQETRDIQGQYGLSPTAYLRAHGVFERPVTAAHCVHLTPADIEMLAAADVGVVHNPGSNLKLGSGIADLPALVRAGLRVGLGTDGAASNNKLDMFEEMRLAALVHKGVTQDATVIPAQAALALATEGGARALFLEDGLGTLRPGAPADIVLLDIAGPRYAPRHNLVSHVVYASCAEDVTDVFVAGQHLYASREFLTLDRERIVHDANRAGLSLTATAQARTGSAQ